MMRSAIRLTAMLVLLGGVHSAGAQSAHPDFTGTWVLDVAKSSSTQEMPTSASWAIVQHGDTITADRETVTPSYGTIKSHVVIGADGRPWNNVAPQPGIGEIPTTSIVTWDAAALIITTSGNVQGTDFVQTDHWTVSSDGHTLTSTRSVTVEGQEYANSTSVFTKK